MATGNYLSLSFAKEAWIYHSRSSETPVKRMYRFKLFRHT